MSLDFMLFDKPVINTVFGNKSNNLYDDQRFLNYLHYKHVIDSNAVSIAKNEKELHLQLSEALTNPEFRKQYRENLINLEIGFPLEGTSKRIVKALKEFV
jgi:pyoverdine/dityrosine biosynthesis protein Dit1